MRKYLATILITATFISGCSLVGLNHESEPESAPLRYEINLNDRTDDLFKVNLYVDDLTSENAVYQFAATAPGTYQVMDIGRFVREFEAFDASGEEIAVQQISTNQWQISAPERVAEIHYTVAETWDTPVDSNQVYRMAGTSIEPDHVQINGQCVFGYPTGMQARPLRIKLEYPDEWLLGTALSRDKQGYFRADNYDQVVDSPFLLGTLSKAALKVKGSKIEIYTYSKTGKVKSEQILQSIDDILRAAADFTEGLPVDRYTFLFHFEDVNYGAWEHSYSSIYTYSEDQFAQLIQQNIPTVVAHEFFHVVTPLNIHSEIIEHFNFVEPVPSEHLWLYEGTTEWAAHIMQLRAGLIDLQQYLNVLKHKLNIEEVFQKDYSLHDLAMQSFTGAGQKQYPNIYMRGALVAGLLDILLLDLSHGKQGLREVINDLSEAYGPKRSFSETGFYDDFVNRTHPEVADFFESYIKNAEPLPIAEYYRKLGIGYTPEVHTGEMEPSTGFAVVFSEGRLALAKTHEKIKAFGLQDGDIFVALNGDPITMQNARAKANELRAFDVGVPYDLTIERDGEDLTFTCERIMQEQVDKHVLTPDSSATPAQLKLRKAWITNL